MLPIIIALLALLLWIMYTVYSNRSRSKLIPKVIGNGQYAVEVVSANNYLASFKKIYWRRPFGGADIKGRGHLILENDDIGDKQAVRVLIEGYTVGYLPSKAARDLQQAIVCVGLAHVRIFECPAVIRRRWENSGSRRCQYSVWLDLPRDEVLQP